VEIYNFSTRYEDGTESWSCCDLASQTGRSRPGRGGGDRGNAEHAQWELTPHRAPTAWGGRSRQTAEFKI